MQNPEAQFPILPSLLQVAPVASYHRVRDLSILNTRGARTVAGLPAAKATPIKARTEMRVIFMFGEVLELKVIL
jgi:hypothetical protein